ncbi:DUF4352 domain-containing protein [Saccharopolyspora rectivirgula]|nr:DUF4352 domain-containing protein [Saccharopolyspora rectivirgula]
MNPQEMSHHWTRSDSPRRRKIIAGIGSTLCILAVAITVVIQAQMAKAFDEAFDEALSETAVAEDSEQPADAPEDAPAHNSGEDVTRLGFGATHRWSGGEVITVSKPSPYKEENPFLAPEEGNRFVQFDITVANQGERTYNSMEVTLTAQHNGRIVEQNPFAGDLFPNSELPPGGSVTFTAVYEIPQEQGESRLSVKPNFFAQNTVFYVGQI